MISARLRWVVAALVVGLGWLATPHAVPVFDGIGQPDEPYRYVAPPPGSKKTAAATTAVATSPVKAGRTTNGLSVSSKEIGPQVSMFIPLGGLAAKGTTVRVTAEPAAPTDQPPGATVDGNVYRLTMKDGVGPVAFTDKAALAVIYLRATTGEQPGPVMYRRGGPGQSWEPLKTSRGGVDFYVSSLTAPGEYALAFVKGTEDSGGVQVLPLLLLGGVVLLVVVVLVVRLRAREA